MKSTATTSTTTTATRMEKQVTEEGDDKGHQQQQQQSMTPPTLVYARIILGEVTPLLAAIKRTGAQHWSSHSQVRSPALTTLQQVLLTHNRVLLTATRWEELFHRVLFPLLNGLIELPLLLQLPQQQQQLLPQQQLQLQQLEEARLRAVTLVMKVYLRHLSPLLTLPTFTALWLTILDFLDKYLSVSNDHLASDKIEYCIFVLEDASMWKKMSYTAVSSVIEKGVCRLLLLPPVEDGGKRGSFLEAQLQSLIREYRKLLQWP